MAVVLMRLDFLLLFGWWIRGKVFKGGARFAHAHHGGFATGQAPLIFSSSSGVAFSRMISVWFSTGDEVLQTALLHHASLRHDAYAVAHFLQLLHGVESDHDGNAALLEFHDEVADASGTHGVHTGGRLVEDQQSRLLNERLRQAS